MVSLNPFDPGDADSAETISTSTATDFAEIKQLGHAPFPVEVLPRWLADHVNCLAAYFLLSPDAVATLALAQLAGVLVRNRSVRMVTNTPLDLPFSIIVAAQDAPTLSMALTESNKALADLQQTHLELAASFDRRRAAELMAKPRMLLPESALPQGNVEPKDMEHWRTRLVRLYQQPLFWLEGPGARELKAGFASSFDRTLLATFSKESWLEKLVATRRDREGNRLGELLAQLVQGGHLVLPASPKNPGSNRMAQTRFGLVGLTTSATLAQALKDERGDVRTLLYHSVLLDLAPVDPNLSTTPRPSSDQMQQPGNNWRHMVASLLEERRAAESRSLEPHGCFHEALADWPRRLQELARPVPLSLQGHLAAFTNLPLKLGSLLLAVGHYGVWKDAEAAQGARKIAEWMFAHTLSRVVAEQEDQRGHAMADAREKMLAKIVKHGPIDFWRLCRLFDNQSKALHEPTLHALLDEKRVRLNAEGKLVAAA